MTCDKDRFQIHVHLKIDTSSFSLESGYFFYGVRYLLPVHVVNQGIFTADDTCPRGRGQRKVICGAIYLKHLKTMERNKLVLKRSQGVTMVQVSTAEKNSLFFQNSKRKYFFLLFLLFNAIDYILLLMSVAKVNCCMSIKHKDNGDVYHCF